MTDDHAGAIGGLKESAENAAEAITALRLSNENRREENIEFALELKDIHHAVEESNVSSGRAVELMEGMTKTVKDFEALVLRIEDRVAVLERNRVDFAKVFRWLGTGWGVFFMLGMAALLLGSFIEGSRDFIIDLAGAVGKAIG